MDHDMTLTKLIELQAAATTGPWIADGVRNNRIIWSSPDDRVCFMTSDGKPEQNSAFITAARNFDFAALDAKIKRYEDALRFYANGKNYGAVPVCCGNGNIHGCCGNYQPDYEIMNDVGNRAKQALEGME